jgi:DNA invertase Pin-like site-specific DNA recombinase
LRNAKAKGKRIGRPRHEVDSSMVLKLRADGLSWRAVSEHLKLGLGTVYRAASLPPKG